MMRIFLMVTIFCMPALGQTPKDWKTQIDLISKKHPECLMLAVVYNARTHQNIQLPAGVGRIRLIGVPIVSINDISRKIKGGLLAQHAIQAMYVVDDGEKLVSRGKTLKYLAKLAKSHSFHIFTDKARQGLSLTGWISKQDGTYTITYDK